MHAGGSLPASAAAPTPPLADVGLAATFRAGRRIRKGRLGCELLGPDSASGARRSDRSPPQEPGRPKVRLSTLPSQREKLDCLHPGAGRTPVARPGNVGEHRRDARRFEARPGAARRGTPGRPSGRVSVMGCLSRSRPINSARTRERFPATVRSEDARHEAAVSREGQGVRDRVRMLVCAGIEARRCGVVVGRVGRSG